MSKKTLRTDVHVANDAGETQVFKAGTTPPAGVAKRITNPKAWADDEPAEAEGEDDPVLPEDAPPLGGKGSGTDEWRTYATERFQLEVADDADRDDIVAAVAAAHAEQNDGS